MKKQNLNKNKKYLMNNLIIKMIYTHFVKFFGN